MALDDLRKGSHYFVEKYRVLVGVALAGLSLGMMVGGMVVGWILGLFRKSDTGR